MDMSRRWPRSGRWQFRKIVETGNHPGRPCCVRDMQEESIVSMCQDHPGLWHGSDAPNNSSTVIASIKMIVTTRLADHCPNPDKLPMSSTLWHFGTWKFAQVARIFCNVALNLCLSMEVIKVFMIAGLIASMQIIDVENVENFDSQTLLFS